jgi:transcriptional regulator with XRE-family HTH domain
VPSGEHPGVPGSLAYFSGGSALPVPVSPTVRRRRLGIELRRLRQAADAKLEEVADRIGVRVSTLSRIETGKAPCRAAYVTTMLDMYGVADEKQRQVLVEMARQGQQRGWWAIYDDVLPAGFEIYVGLETEAASLRAYDTHLIHGLLQTEEYARELFRASRPNDDPESIQRLVDLRMRRQQVLTRDEPFDLWVVLDEAVLHRAIGGRQVMYEQLGRLVDAAAAPHVTLQVLPFAKGSHAGMDGTFSLLEFPEQTELDVVFIECPAGSIYLEKLPDIRRYSLMFDRLRADALPPDESADFLTLARTEFK